MGDVLCPSGELGDGEETFLSAVDLVFDTLESWDDFCDEELLLAEDFLPLPLLRRLRDRLGDFISGSGDSGGVSSSEAVKFIILGSFKAEPIL